MTFDAVLFDMDNTLVHSFPQWRAADKQVCAQYGVDITADLYQQAHEHFHNGAGGGTLAFVARLIEVTGIACTPEQFEAEVIRTMAQRIQQAPWMPGARELITDLAEIAATFGLVSTAEKPIVDGFLSRFPMNPFGAVVTGNDCAPKPDPAPYLMAAELLGVKPSRCVAVEDSRIGAQSATAAGCNVVLVPYKTTKITFSCTVAASLEHVTIDVLRAACGG